MSKDRLGYLSPGEQQRAGALVTGLELLKDRYPALSQVDLVIEGGVGTSRIMSHVARKFFPNALYVGTDISEMLVSGRRRQRRCVDEDTLQRVLKTNEYADLGIEGAILYASCFDADLIRDIANKAGRKHIFLTSYDALNALLYPDMNPLDKKDNDDIITISDMVRRDSPFTGQLHLISDGDLWTPDKQAAVTEHNYQKLELEGKAEGWTTDRMTNGLLLLRTA